MSASSILQLRNPTHWTEIVERSVQLVQLMNWELKQTNLALVIGRVVTNGCGNTIRRVDKDSETITMYDRLLIPT